MKTINVHNYKEFAIDYMVENLSAQEAEAFTLFLSKHPDIANEILLFNPQKFEPKSDPKRFNNLKKDISEQTINIDNFEEYCIASLEGDLDVQTEKKLADFIGNNEEYQTTKAAYSKTKLVPENIEYPHKEKLKKTVSKPVLYRRFITISSTLVAASIIAFALFFVLPKPQDDTTSIVADNSTNTTKTTDNTKTVKTINPIQIKNEQSLADNSMSQLAQKAPEIKNEKEKAETSESKENNKGIDNTTEVLKKLNHKKIAISQNPVAINSIELATPSFDANKASSETSKDEKLKTAANKLLYSKVIAQSVRSINKMAESNLGYEVVQDENGNPIRVTIKSRFGEISRPLAQN